MSGRTVLVTRPEPGASRTAARLAQDGYRPVLTPFLSVQPCAAALPAASGLQAVVAASGNATRLPAAYHGIPLLAVGQATAARAMATGFSDVRSADGDAAALARLAGATLAPGGGPLLLATGRGEGAALAALLQGQGFTVHRRAVYASSAITLFPQDAAEAIRQGTHAILFFSAATAHAFARLMPPELRGLLDRTVAVVIGPAAADALRGLPWRSLRVAVRPTQDGVLAQL